MKYRAFLSYAHSDNRHAQRLWADWMHDRMEGFVVPPELAGTEGRFGKVPERIYPVFQDDKELPTSADLGTAICEALEQSRVLVVLCSPNSARSHWVNEEILAFKRLGREGSIIAGILWGEPNASAGKEGFSTNDECFPEALRYRLAEDGTVDRSRPAEPIAADFRDPVTGAQSNLNERGLKEHFDREFLRITAGVLGVGFESLMQRNVERERRELKQRRRRKVLLVALSVLTLVGGSIGGVSYLRSIRERQVSMERRFEAALSRSAEARVRGSFETGWEALQEARELGLALGDRERELAMEASPYLSSTRYPLATLGGQGAGGESLSGVSLHDLSNTGLFVERPSGALVEYDLLTHTEKRRISIVDGPEGWTPTFELAHGPLDSAPTTIVVAAEEGGRLMFLDYETGNLTASHEFKGGVSAIRANWGADLVAVTCADETFLRLFRLSDGSAVATAAASGEEGEIGMEGWDATWLDDQRLAVACTDGSCRIVTVDGSVEQVLRHPDYRSGFLAVCATFDQIVVGTGTGELLFWSRHDWSFKGSVITPNGNSVMRIVPHTGPEGVENPRHLAVLLFPATLSWVDPRSLRIVGSQPIGGGPRVDLVLSGMGVLYVTGMRADAWVHSSSPEMRWGLPGASQSDLDAWSVTPANGMLVGFGRSMFVGCGRATDGKSPGYELEVKGVEGTVESLHVDPAEPRRLLVVCEDRLVEVDLRAGLVVGEYPRPENAEELTIRGAGFRAEGGVYAIHSNGEILLWAGDGAGAKRVASGWEAIKAVLPCPEPGMLALSGGEDQLATLTWDTAGGAVLTPQELGEGRSLIGLAMGDGGPCAVLSSSQLDQIRILPLRGGRLAAEGWDVPVTPQSVRPHARTRLVPLAISERNRLVARGGERGIQVFDLQSGRLLHELGTLEGEVAKLAFFGPANSLVYEVDRVEIGERDVRQAVWDWREGALLVEKAVPKLEGLRTALPPESLPRYYMARGACAHAILTAAATAESQWPALLDPRSVSRHGIGIATAKDRLLRDGKLVHYLREQAAASQGQFVRSIDPLATSLVSDYGASRVSESVLEGLLLQYDTFPADIPAVLALLDDRIAYERWNPLPPLQKSLLLARKPEPEGVEAVRLLGTAFARWPEVSPAGKARESRQLVTAARLFADWKGADSAEPRRDLLNHVRENLERYLNQYWTLRSHQDGDSPPVAEEGEMQDTVESLGRYTIDYNLALPHRAATLQLCRDLLIACKPAGSHRLEQILDGLALEAWCALSDEAQVAMEREDLERLIETAGAVLSAPVVEREPFEFAFRTKLTRMQQLLLESDMEAAGAMLEDVDAAGRKGLRELPESPEMPLLAADVARLRLQLAAERRDEGEFLEIVRGGVAGLTPVDGDEQSAATAYRHEHAGQLALDTAFFVEAGEVRIELLRMATQSFEAAFTAQGAEMERLREGPDDTVKEHANGLRVVTDLDAYKARRDHPIRYRAYLESFVNAGQELGSALLERGDVDAALRAYRHAEKALAAVLEGDDFSGGSRSELAWHHIWTLQRIAVIEVERSADAPLSQAALLSWIAAAREEALATEDPEAEILSSWAEAVDLLAASPHSDLIEGAVDSYQQLLAVVSVRKFENAEDEQMRQRILIVGHFNRSFLARENRIRGVDIVGEFEAAMELLDAHNPNPANGSWEHEMRIKLLVELEREYRGDGEEDLAERAAAERAGLLAE